jgi:hypothetical protein
MLEWNSELIIAYFVVYKEQLIALGVVPGDPDSAAKAIADLKAELDKEKAAQEIAHVEVDTLTRPIKDFETSSNKFAAQTPTLEEKVKHLENKVVDGLNEVRARELCLEHNTKANGDYQKQSAQLTRKLESNFPWSFKALSHSLYILWLNPLWFAESDAELNALKVMVNNAVAFFYLGVSSSGTHDSQLLDSLSTRSQEIILTNMKQSESLNLGILKSLYPWADLDTASKGFAATCRDEEALKLVEDSAMTVGNIMDMLGVDMSLG